ncbi:MAG: hypothetical protein PHO15_04585 [Eubacteriales bacterium]|nr:hypothetical protein [Eubacteriales bacterium]
MQKILEDLYFGNTNPNEKQFVRDSDYDKTLRVICGYEEKLIGLLNGKEKSLFFDYVNAQSEINSITAIEYFADGFRTGAKIMLAVMSDTTGCLRDIQ